MTGRIPKYGANFRLERLPYQQGMASRRYVSKTDPRYFIRSTNDSKTWRIYMAGPAGAAFPLGSTSYSTFSKAMEAATFIISLARKG